MKTIVTKGEYAVLKGRTPSAVSNWIAEGKITPAALQGDGNRARVWVEQADADLARSLDPGQQASQTVPVVPGVPVAPTGVGDNVLDFRSPRANASALEDEDIRRRRKADADKAEHDAEAARRKLFADEGKWIDAAGAAREWSRELAGIVSDFETFLTTTLARDVAERHGLDWKPLSTSFRDLYRKHRLTLADDAKAKREQMEQVPAEAAQ